MTGIPRTDVELLRCAPPVDITMFPDARVNMIAQDFGKYYFKLKYVQFQV